MEKLKSKRKLILDIAENGILTKGFGATSIDEIIAEAEITKSGFFYHFRGKGDLAQALLQRYIETEKTFLDNAFARSRELHEDPLCSFLIGLKLISEMIRDLTNGHPGGLVTTVAYCERMSDRDVRFLIRQALIMRRQRFLGMLQEIASVYPVQKNSDLRTVADMISATIEGGIMMSRAIGEPTLFVDQINLLRSFVSSLFSQRPGSSEIQ